MQIYFKKINLIKIPECPEVRLTVDFLKSRLENNIIKEWVFTGGKYTDDYPEGYAEFDIALPLKVIEVNCKGKFIYFKLQDNEDTKYFILHSLMMTGRWQSIHDEYCKWFVELEDKSLLWFRDTRALGVLRFTSDESILENKLTNLGPDIMGIDFKLPNFIKLCEKYSTRNICSFLMDQTIIAGCGNYIKAEVLYYAKISPLRKTGSMSKKEIEKLYQGLYIIPRISYNNKGLNYNGKKGYYENKLKIYGKDFAEKTKTPDGRNTYWNPKIQK